MLVPTIRTTCTVKELCEAIFESWYKLFGTILPSKTAVGILVSQIGLETGGQYNQWNWNLGNVKYVASNGNVDYMALNGVYEIVNGQKVMIPITNPGAWFRSFPSLNDGANFYLNFLRNGRYNQAWVAAERGDIVGFAHELRSAGYYTASEQNYLNGMMRYYNLYMNSDNYEAALTAFKNNNVEFPPDYNSVDLTTNKTTPTINNNTVIAIPATVGNFISSFTNRMKTIFNVGK